MRSLSPVDKERHGTIHRHGVRIRHAPGNQCPVGRRSPTRLDRSQSDLGGLRTDCQPVDLRRSENPGDQPGAIQQVQTKQHAPVRAHTIGIRRNNLQVSPRAERQQGVVSAERLMAATGSRPDAQQVFYLANAGVEIRRSVNEVINLGRSTWRTLIFSMMLRHSRDNDAGGSGRQPLRGRPRRADHSQGRYGSLQQFLRFGSMRISQPLSVSRASMKR